MQEKIVKDFSFFPFKFFTSHDRSAFKFYIIYYVCIDYVAEIWKDLGMSKEKRKSVAEKYSAKVPQPLNSQFPDRVEKSEAVGRYEKRQEKEVTKLYPPGKAPVICHIKLSVFPMSLGVTQN